MKSKEVYREQCIICKNWFDYEPVYCCTNSDCMCQGRPLNPPVCSQVCADELSRRYIKKVEDYMNKNRGSTQTSGESDGKVRQS